jgi:hypothetical protein
MLHVSGDSFPYLNRSFLFSIVPELGIAVYQHVALIQRENGLFLSEEHI